MDVWMTLCREKAWNRHDYTKYAHFIAYLKEQKVQLTRAPQGHPMKDASGKPVETYTIKLDKATIDKMRSFA